MCVVMVWFVVLGAVCGAFVCVFLIVCVLYALCEFLGFWGCLLVMFVFFLCLFVRCMIIVNEVLYFVIIFLVFGFF
jgi:hypothetical protein